MTDRRAQIEARWRAAYGDPNLPIDVLRDVQWLLGILAEAEAERDEARGLGSEQCCPDVCNSGACETCVSCSAGWCVNGHDFATDPDAWEGMSDEDRHVWWEVAREHNRGLDAALAERDALAAKLAAVEGLVALEAGTPGSVDGLLSSLRQALDGEP